jgi:hypothetical protein
VKDKHRDLGRAELNQPAAPVRAKQRNRNSLIFTGLPLATLTA